MKKLISTTALALAFLTTLIYQGCKKEAGDQTAPVISMGGYATCFLQKGHLYVDANATAIDNTDGVVQVTSAVDVNPSVLGLYVIKYSATDKAGNVGTASRNVYVVDVMGSYQVTKISPYPATSSADTSYYADTVSLQNDLSGRMSYLHFSNNVGGFAYDKLVDGNNLNLPSQLVNCGGPAIDRTWSGSGTISNTNAPHTKITINYTEVSDTIHHSEVVYIKN